MMNKYSHNAHATWKHAPMKPAREITSTTNPITNSGVWKKFSQLVLLLAIHRPAPMMGIDAKRLKKFKNPITVLLNRCISHTPSCFLTSLSLSLSLFPYSVIVILPGFKRTCNWKYFCFYLSGSLNKASRISTFLSSFLCACFRVRFRNL